MKPKVVFINMYQKSALRGAETFVDNVSRRLTSQFEVVVIGGGRKPKNRWPILWRTFLDPHGIQVALFTIGILPKLFKIRPDILIPVNGGPMPIILKLFTLIAGGKIIISGQSGVGWDERVNLWTFPDAFVALSDKALKWARKVSPFVKSVLIPNGVDLKKFTPVGPKVKTTLKSPIVLCQGALTKEKRIDLTVKAVSRLDDVSLMIVGNPGDASENISALCKDLLPGRYEIRSFPSSDMPSVYRRADVFTLVSKPYFSFEIAVIEAMACNLPVVVNDDPIRRSIAEPFGYFVDPNDTNNYAKTLTLALKKGSINERKAVLKFDWDEISLKYAKLINQVLKK